MTDQGAPTTQWQALALAADEGHLYLGPGAAAACHLACEIQISKLVMHQTKAKQLRNINGWGEFKAGRQLRDIYADKAMGGNNNMVDVLESHVQVVREMQAVFAKFFVIANDNDESNASDIQRTEPTVG